MTRALLALLLVIAGCVPTGGTREAQRYFVLDVSEPKNIAASARRASTLLVERTTASGFYDTQDIVYSRSPGTRAYYQFNGWTERPSRRIHLLLVDRIGRSGAFAEVASAEQRTKNSLVLRTHLEEIYHDAATAPGSARITLSAELYDPARSSVLARRSFRHAAPAASYDAQGAVKAFSASLAALLDEVAAWVEEAAPR